MFTRFTLIVAMVTLLAAPALAQVPPEEAIRGEIVTVDDYALTLKLNTGQHATYAIDEDTVMPENLSEGDRVAVQNLPGTGDDGLETAVEIVRVDTAETADTSDTETVDTDMTADAEMHTDTEATAAVETEEPERTGTQIAQIQPQEQQPTEEQEPTEEYEASGDESGDDAYLPQTATPTAALLVVGLLALVGGVTIRRLYL